MRTGSVQLSSTLADHAAAIMLVVFGMTQASPKCRMALAATDMKLKSSVVTKTPDHHNVQAGADARYVDFVSFCFFSFSQG